MPVIPATQEAEAGESLEPETWSCGEPGLGNKSKTLSLKKKKKKNLKKFLKVYHN